MLYWYTKWPEMTSVNRSVSADWSVDQTKNPSSQIDRGLQNNQFRLKLFIFMIFLLFSMNFWSWTLKLKNLQINEYIFPSNTPDLDKFLKNRNKFCKMVKIGMKVHYTILLDSVKEILWLMNKNPDFRDQTDLKLIAIWPNIC